MKPSERIRAIWNAQTPPGTLWIPTTLEMAILTHLDEQHELAQSKPPDCDWSHIKTVRGRRLEHK